MRLCMKIVGFGGNSTPLHADIGIWVRLEAKKRFFQFSSKNMGISSLNGGKIVSPLSVLSNYYSLDTSHSTCHKRPILGLIWIGPFDSLGVTLVWIGQFDSLGVTWRAPKPNEITQSESTLCSSTSFGLLRRGLSTSNPNKITTI